MTDRGNRAVKSIITSHIRVGINSKVVAGEGGELQKKIVSIFNAYKKKEMEVGVDHRL